MLKASGKPRELSFATADGRIAALFEGKPAAFVLGEHKYAIANISGFVPAYHLRRRDALVASARRALFLSRYAVDSADKVWTLTARGLTERKYALLNDKAEVGAIYPISFFNPYREIVVDLPGEIAIEIQVFMTWIVVSSWSDD
jgi:hypothetical protein